MIFTSSRFISERNVMHNKMVLNQAQTIELITKIGATAVVVFTHYVAISNLPEPDMEDDTIARLTGLSPRVVKRTRLALTQIGWFLRIKDTYNGVTKVTYLVGKRAVAAQYSSTQE